MHVTIQDRELLPHVFTLTATNVVAVFFLWHFLSLIHIRAFPLGSVLLYVARTFLSPA